MSKILFSVFCLISTFLLLFSCSSMKIATKIVFIENDTLQIVNYDSNSNEVKKIDFLENSTNRIVTINSFENNKLIETIMYFNNNEISKIKYDYIDGKLSKVQFYENQKLILSEIYSYEFSDNKIKQEILRKDNYSNFVKFISYFIDNKIIRQVESADGVMLVERIFIYDSKGHLVEI